eukprot:46118_1
MSSYKHIRFTYWIYVSVTLLGLLESVDIVVDGSWTPKTPSLPRRCNMMAMGSWNNSIFMIGGTYGIGRDYRSRQLIEYNTASHRMIDHGDTYFDQILYGYGQFYTQQRNHLYILSGSGGRSISMIDVSLNTLRAYWNIFTAPKSAGVYACLESNDEYIFVIGGYEANLVLDHFQILHLPSAQWLSNPPSLNVARRGASCALHGASGSLYAMGGRRVLVDGETKEALKSVEKISIVDVESNVWKITTDLLHAADEARTVMSSHYIVVIGGWNGFDPQIANAQVQIMDTTTDTVYVTASPVNWVVGAPGIALVHGTIYKFGGTFGQELQFFLANQWESYFLTDPTPPPTQEPSPAPSNLPTTPTTARPTKRPTTATTRAADIGNTTSNDKDDPGAANEPVVTEQASMILIGLAIVVFICIVGVCVLWIYYWKQHRDKERKPNEMVSLDEIDCDPIIEMERAKVMTWLKSIGAVEYYQCFIDNGFDTMDSIMCIKDHKILQDIGVQLIGKRVFIWNRIKRLNDTNTAASSGVQGEGEEDTTKWDNVRGINPMDRLIEKEQKEGDILKMDTGVVAKEDSWSDAYEPNLESALPPPPMSPDPRENIFKDSLSESYVPTRGMPPPQ